MKIIPGNAQHIGSRKEQQDDFGFSDIADAEFAAHGGVLAVLADGMGGMAMGKEAGRMAVRTLLKAYGKKLPEETIAQALDRALSHANQAVFDMAEAAGLAEDVGATLAAAVIHQETLHWVSVGDSRIYLFRKGELTRLTTDHIYARELVREVAKGNITKADAESHPERESLTSYLGLPEITETDRNVNPFPLQPGDRILLCSDGLYRALSEKEIAGYLDGNPQEAAESLIQKTLAKKRVHQDNVTLAILGCEPEDISSDTASSQKPASTGFGKTLFLALLLAGLGFAVWTYKDDITNVVKTWTEEKAEDSWCCP